MSRNADALIELIHDKLIGKKITGVATTEDKNSVGLVLSDGMVAWIDCDMEGNDVGWLNVEGDV